METVRLHRFKHSLLPCPWILFFLFFIILLYFFNGASMPAYPRLATIGILERAERVAYLLLLLLHCWTRLLLLFSFFLSKAVSASQALQG